MYISFHALRALVSISKPKSKTVNSFFYITEGLMFFERNARYFTFKAIQIMSYHY